MERLTMPDEHIEGGIRRAVIDARTVKEKAMIIYWALKKYEDTGLTPEDVIDGKMLTGWIPVAERLPEVELQKAIEERGEYAVVPVLVSAQKRDAEGKAYIVTDRAFYFQQFGAKNFHNDKAEPMKALAWMPLPEPYKEAEG